MRQRNRLNGGKPTHRFSWINERKEYFRPDGCSDGIELILADWFFSGVMDDALVLTLDPTYFQPTGGIERWLYRLVRKHGGRQPSRLAVRHAPLAPEVRQLQRPSDFALQMREPARRQSLPGYRLYVERSGVSEWLLFRSDADNSPETSSSDFLQLLLKKLWNRCGRARWITRRTFGGWPAPTGREATPSNGFGTP